VLKPRSQAGSNEILFVSESVTRIADVAAGTFSIRFILNRYERTRYHRTDIYMLGHKHFLVLLYDYPRCCEPMTTRAVAASTLAYEAQTHGFVCFRLLAVVGKMVPGLPE